MEPKYSGIQPGQNGIFLDVEYIPAAKFGDTAETLRDPYLAGAVRDAAILFDRNGEFTRGRCSSAYDISQDLGLMSDRAVK